MNDKAAIIAIDQGTTSSRTILFSLKGEIIYSAQQEFPQIYPADGWVEHDPDTIWSTVYQTLCNVIDYAYTHNIRLLGIGLTNQRETTVVWHSETGKPIYNAIVWQDRRTANFCDSLRGTKAEQVIQSKTGLLIDPYFSGSKIKWILDNVEGAKQDANDNKLAFGTIDSFLIYRLTQGKNHVTDATNASRTQLYDIANQQWDDTLLSVFGVPKSLLPKVLNCADDFGTADINGKQIPIVSVAGDQQAAAIGQCCFREGAVKSTYGTGCFVLINTGKSIKQSQHRLLSTVAYRLNGESTYALEGSIFVAGAAVQWLRDELKIIENAAETEQICEQLTSNQSLYLVPAFTGLGAPYWDANARGALVGITRATNGASLVRAAIESVVYQTSDLLKSIESDGIVIEQLKVDGGMTTNNWMLNFLADILNIEIQRPTILETSALGVTYLAMLQLGIHNSLEAIEQSWSLDQTFTSSLDDDVRQQLLNGWQKAIHSVLS